MRSRRSRGHPVERRSSRIVPAAPADLRVKVSPRAYATPSPSVVHGKAIASATLLSLLTTSRVIVGLRSHRRRAPA
jgi:hypothetical protein